MDFNDDSSNSEDEFINTDDLSVVASLVRRQQQLQEEIAERNERLLEKQEEVQDLDKMIQIGELSMKDVLSELDTPVNSDSEEDEVDCLLINIYICVRRESIQLILLFSSHSAAKMQQTLHEWLP